MEVAERHEQTLAARGLRKGLGAYYTPADVVEGLLDIAFDPVLDMAAAHGPAAVAALRVIDPACGTGNFLVAVSHRIAGALRRLGLQDGEAAERAVACVHGIELDASTARLCRADLRGVHPSFPARRIRRGDALLDPTLAAEGTFDLVIGNPPFLSQLDATTSRDVAGGAALRARFGAAVAGYTDPAALFLLLGHRLARPDGGVVAMIEPIPLLTARDATGARQAVLHDASLTDLWVLGNGVFDAAVEVCAPVIVRSTGSASAGPSAVVTRLHTGRQRAVGELVDAPTATTRSWSHLLADHGGLPRRALRTSGTLADLASATADFRDQYYGLGPHVIDGDRADAAPEERTARLVTSGLIDPAWLAWGARSTRFHKTTYRHPRVLLDALDPALRRWADSRLVPKVLLATQTRMLEAVVDEAGDWLPSVPVISVVPTRSPDDLWRIAAVLTCPAINALASRRHLGSGRNARSLRLRASEVLELPLPVDRERWDEAAALLRAAGPPTRRSGHLALLAAAAALMDRAYGIDADGDLLAWWLDLLPAMAELSEGPPPAAAPAS